MSTIIYPRSPREVMDGWTHLPRYVDKVRLHLAGQLSADYQNNFGKGFDAMWLKAAGLSHEQMIEVVKQTITDGQVCDWVHLNAGRPAAEKQAHREAMLGFPPASDAALQERLQERKAACGLGQRADIKTFVDLIDADEKRI